MRRPCKTVNAAVLATAIGIDAPLEAHVGAVVAREDCFCGVVEELCLAPRSFLCCCDWIDNINVRHVDVEFFKAIGRTPGSTSAMNRFETLRCFLDYRVEFSFRHLVSSHERIYVSSVGCSCRCPQRQGAKVHRTNFFCCRRRRQLQSSRSCSSQRQWQNKSAQGSGGVVEWLMAPVLKTGRPKGLVGSNPTPSAN